MESFSTNNVVDVIGIQDGRLREWLNRHYIIPSIEVAEGPGTKNIFSYFDLCSIELFRIMIDDFEISRSRAQANVEIWKKLISIAVKKSINKNDIKYLFIDMQAPYFGTAWFSKDFTPDFDESTLCITTYGSCPEELKRPLEEVTVSLFQKTERIEVYNIERLFTGIDRKISKLTNR